MDNAEYCENKLKDIVEPLFFTLVTNRPKDIVNFSIDWLIKKGGLTSSGLTLDERDELLSLRKEIIKYREIESEHQKKSHNTFERIKEDEDSEDEKEESSLEVEDNTVTIRGPRIAVSAEAYGHFNKKGEYKSVVFTKSEDLITTIKGRIIQSFLFNSLEENDLKIVIDAMEEIKFNKEDAVINQGDYGDCLYIVERGDLDCYKKFSNGEEKLVKKYSAGDVFGELALLYNSPRAAKVVAKADVTLWKLDRETFNAIVKEAAM
jgi:cAMP-dependent protein kinase regulator